jgi:hypothetical protein
MGLATAHRRYSLISEKEGSLDVGAKDQEERAGYKEEV